MYTVAPSPQPSRFAARVADWATPIFMRAFEQAWYKKWSRPVPQASRRNNILSDIIGQSPVAYGYRQAVWTVVLLHQHLVQALGIDVTLPALANRLCALNIQLPYAA